MKKLLTLAIILMSFGFVNAQSKKTSGPNYKNLSIDYVVSKLRSPGSAQLVAYSGVSEARTMLVNAGFKLNDCTKVTRVVIDSQNGFGALIRGFYFVFFKNEEPCHMEESQSLTKSAGYGNMTSMLYVALDMNNCDCSK